jgi:uncharacterized protein (TIGR03435 family)
VPEISLRRLSKDGAEQFVNSPLSGYILCFEEATVRQLLLFLSPILAAAQSPRLEFEVASIKALAEGAHPGLLIICRGGPGTSDPTLFTCPGAPLKRLIMRAYALPDFEVSAPGWAEEQRFEIKATVPAGATKEQFETMLQNLLIDRLKLEVHREPKEIARYELTVAEGGPKLKDVKQDPEPTEDTPPAAPSSPADIKAWMKAQDKGVDRDGYPIRTTPGWSTRDGRGTFYEPHGPVQSLILFLNMQMDKPVVDATGLKGTYEIVMHWAGRGPMSGQLAQMMAQARAARGVPEDTTPEVGPRGPTLQQALRDQLGLKLEAKKGPIDMLMVDHVEKVPTEN